MSKRTHPVHFTNQGTSMSVESEENENGFESSSNSVHFLTKRSPLNAIPDPSQYLGGLLDLDLGSLQKYDGRWPNLSLDNKSEESGGSGTPPRASTSKGKAQSEPSSTHSTPGKRMSNIGTRPPGHYGSRGGSSYKAFRGSSLVNHEDTVAVPNFDLEEDPSFWKDHNVQVLIRIRPLNNNEMISQGHGRCLKQESAQSLVWLGHPETRFTFDHIASESISQEKLFKVAGLPMVDNCISGYNSCMFAYGQTGSGKTYTMMGDVCQIDVKLNEDCGITPRIFEYLFSRIREEEEKRRDERLKFSCRCSFLEIYNEQITDLLEPSSTSLQLREDLKKGVYVENLSEHSVQNVNDVLKLLSQGTANRKMAATYMNSESSRSHSVFTCIVESHWEKDSVTHLRFARLNLVDLAGSERQKSSGAEGDRLKEAASINKSLSTLGLVIMSLVDLAHGKHRHVPYRDSRLTFLLQDSLGGNSKTTVIANVSPSICSAYETLSTLKFAQRAKLIQNNAKINEDASGNVTALQKQIQQLKGQLSLLLEQHHMPSPPQPNLRYSVDSKLPGEVNHHGDMEKLNDNDRKMKSLEAILVGTIRREKLAERTNRRLEAELEHANLLAQQREEEIQKVQRMLKLSRDRISQLELLDHGSVEMHLIEENNVSKEKTQPPQELHDTNSELTRLQVENSSLFKQLSLFQEFYEQGERKKLLAEISELRDQLLETLERKHDGPKHSLWNGAQDIDNAKELKECKHMNSKLIREVDELGTQLEEYICGSKSVTGIERETTLVILANDPSLVESSSKAYEKGEENEFQNKVSNGDLENTSMIVDSLVIQPCNTKKVLEDSQALSEAKKLQEVEALHSKLDQVRRDLENAQLLNHNYHQQQVSKVSEERQTELVREQVEMETAKTILQLQEDIVSLQSELEGKLCNMSKENSRLKKVVAAKDDEIKRLCHDWELATLELTSFLSDGSRSLNDASNEIQSIASSFPCVNGWLNDHVESAAKVVLQKEEIIILLQKSLEDAQEKALEMEQKLDFLKGAAIVFSEVQKEETDLTVSDAIKLAIQPNSKFNSNECLEDKHVLKKDHVTEAGVMPMSNLAITLGSNSQQICHMKDTELATLILESANAISASIKDIDEFASAIQSSIIEVSSFYREFSGTLMQDIFQMREEFKTMKETVVTSGIQFVGDRKYLERTINHDFEKKLEDNCRELTSINSSVKRILHICENPVGISHLEELDVQKDVSASSNSAYLEESLCSIECSNGVSRASFIERTGRTTKQDLDKEYDGHLRSSSNYKESEVSGHSRSSFNNKAVLLCLKEEIEKANDAANYLNILLAPFIKTVDKELESARFYTQELLAQSRFCDMREIVRGEKFNPACCITKLEEVYAAMREADNMLKSLLKANKNANSLADMWKMECNELKVEKESLTNEIEKLQSSISVKDGENKLLQNHINCSQQEINYAVSSLEGTFQQMQTEVVEMLNADHARARETVEGTLHHICMFRSFLEDICVATTENGFLFVLMSDYHKRQSFNSNSKFSSGPCGSMSSLQRDLLGDKNENFLWMDESHSIISRQNEEGDQRLNEGTLVLSDNNLLHENHVLKKELERKDDVLKGLFFDFSLLQEATATTKDYKDERERLLFVLRKVQKELMTKTDQVNGMLDEHIKLKSSLAKYVKGLDQAEGRLYLLSEENENLSVLVKNLQTKNSEFQKQLVEQSDVVNNLENEILRLTCCADEKSLQSMMGDLRRITIEREDLQNLVASLQEKLDLACSFADENEAIATEARLESETSKVYAEQKEEEVKILERSVEELESTINILENKVLEMEEDIENQRLLRDSLEYELEELKERMITVESFTDNIDSENSFQCLSEDQITRKHNKFVEHQEMCKQIRILEEENVELIKEIKQYKEYISEVILHTEAQASQYQEKYTTLEAMLHEVKTNASSATYMALTSDKPEKSSRPRGSSSPFRCITNLVQQTNMEMDRELSDARLRIQELEELLKSSQKEVCVLSTRLAASESMTHDVIRDLLGVKMDITNYANMIDQHQIQRLVEESQQQAQEFIAMKEEITNLKEQVDGLLDQRERYISEAKRRQAEIIASHVKIEQLEEHDRLHTLQNEVLRVENGKLQRRISEMDERLRKLFATQNANALPRIQKQFRLKENGMPAPKQQDDDAEMSKRVEKSRKLLSQVNTELSSYHRYEKLDDGRAAAIGKGILEESNNNDKRW